MKTADIQDSLFTTTHLCYLWIFQINHKIREKTSMPILTCNENKSICLNRRYFGDTFFNYIVAKNDIKLIIKQSFSAKEIDKYLVYFTMTFIYMC
jgi:hypothetical protein